MTSASGRPVHSARSDAEWAIFVFERVTRKRKTSAATSCSAGVSAAERVEQVVLDDPLRAAELLERRASVELVRARLDRRAPEPLEHELQERRLDAPLSPPRLDAGRRRSAREPRRGGRVEHGVDERRLDVVRLLARRQRRFHSAIGPSIASRAAARSRCSTRM